MPLWRQRAGRDEEKLVIWDYHVILIYKPDERCLVFDLDSDLPFPTYFHKYVTETFRTDAILNPEYHRFFRVVPAPLFLQTFASDRRHMKKPDGSWMKPPPPYPCIMPQRWLSIRNFYLTMYTVLGVPTLRKITSDFAGWWIFQPTFHEDFKNVNFINAGDTPSTHVCPRSPRTGSATGCVGRVGASRGFVWSKNQEGYFS